MAAWQNTRGRQQNGCLAKQQRRGKRGGKENEEKRGRAERRRALYSHVFVLPGVFANTVLLYNLWSILVKLGPAGRREVGDGSPTSYFQATGKSPTS